MPLYTLDFISFTKPNIKKCKKSSPSYWALLKPRDSKFLNKCYLKERSHHRSNRTLMISQKILKIMRQGSSRRSLINLMKFSKMISHSLRSIWGRFVSISLMVLIVNVSIHSYASSLGGHSLGVEL